jgi:fucose 4-O-acetylase-like acetyltransferase
VAGLGALAAVPLARASDDVAGPGVRVTAIAVVALIAALVLEWTPLVPTALVLVSGLYAAQLAIDDAALDTTSPAFAAGLLVTAELAYWSLEERDHIRGEPGAGLRHAAFVAALGVATLLVASVLLAVADAVRTKGLAVDLLGAVAAAAALFAIVLFARGHGRTDH